MSAGDQLSAIIALPPDLQQVPTSVLEVGPCSMFIRKR